jgi:hypothetical protein
MIINLERLEQAGYRVSNHDHIIHIEPRETSGDLARTLREGVDLPEREREPLIEEFISKVNNAQIMRIINEEY